MAAQVDWNCTEKSDSAKKGQQKASFKKLNPPTGEQAGYIVVKLALAVTFSFATLATHSVCLTPDNVDDQPSQKLTIDIKIWNDAKIQITIEAAWKKWPR